MQIQKIQALYFSPTRTTQTVVKHIANTIAAALSHIPTEFVDFTSPETRKTSPRIDSSTLAIVGLPVYAGRLPNLLLRYLVSWKSEGAIAVPIVVYGNRSYGNALKELHDLLQRVGFHPIAAAAFVGQHSFSPLLASGRPDSKDLQIATSWTEEIVQRILHSDGKNFSSLVLPGEGGPDYGGYYKPLGSNGQAVNFLKSKPITSTACTRCMHCVALCPMGAIDGSDPALIPGVCIKCNACIKYCPSGAKQMIDEAYLSHVHFLIKNYASHQAAIELF